MYNIIVVVNGGKNVIPRKLLDELAEAAGAESWECVDLPAESRRIQRAVDEPSASCNCESCSSMLLPHES
jgi:hypothetical protein